MEISCSFPLSLFLTVGVISSCWGLLYFAVHSYLRRRLDKQILHGVSCRLVSILHAFLAVIVSTYTRTTSTTWFSEGPSHFYFFSSICGLSVCSVVCTSCVWCLCSVVCVVCHVSCVCCGVRVCEERYRGERLCVRLSLCVCVYGMFVCWCMYLR